MDRGSVLRRVFGGREADRDVTPQKPPIPAEFKEGDRVRIAVASQIPYEPLEEATENRAYFTVTHVATGKTLTVWHETDGWLLENRS